VRREQMLLPCDKRKEGQAELELSEGRNEDLLWNLPCPQ
jgi:hypothetical protein